MPRGGACPVCELPHDFGARARHDEPAAPQGMAAHWRSGRLPIALAAACFLGATFAPLLFVQRRAEVLPIWVQSRPGVMPRVGASPLQMILQDGPYAREMKSMVAFAIPATALALLSFLISRRHGSVMVATRPLVFVVALLPLVGAILPILKIAKRQRLDYAIGPGMAILAAGVVLGIIGAVTFGRGVPDPPRPSLHGDDDED